MPVMEGTKLLEYMPRRKLGRAHVLLVSSIAEAKLCDLAAACGADGYFCKRDGVDHLCDLVHQKTQTPTAHGR